MIELILTVAGLAALLGYGLYAAIVAWICLRNERAEHRRMMAPLVTVSKGRDPRNGKHNPSLVDRSGAR